MTTSECNESTGTYNRIGIDIKTARAKKRIMCRLARLKTTDCIEDRGEYMFPQETGWHKIILVTTRTEMEVDNWLHKLRLPYNDWEYGTFTGDTV